MCEIIPAYSALHKVLDGAAADLRKRTGISWNVWFNSVERVIRVESADGFHSAIRLQPMATEAEYIRGRDEPIGGKPPNYVERCKVWFQAEFDTAVESFVRGRECWLKGAAPEDAWRNSPGEIYATIMEGAVTVRWLDIIDSMAAPAHWSFYLVDKLAFHASRRLLGEAPSEAMLTVVWKAYQDGLKAGERTGYADGRRAIKRELGALLSEAA